MQVLNWQNTNSEFALLHQIEYRIFQGFRCISGILLYFGYFHLRLGISEMDARNKNVLVPVAGEGNPGRLVGNWHKEAEGSCIDTPFFVNSGNHDR